MKIIEKLKSTGLAVDVARMTRARIGCSETNTAALRVCMAQSSQTSSGHRVQELDFPTATLHSILTKTHSYSEDSIDSSPSESNTCIPK